MIRIRDLEVGDVVREFASVYKVLFIGRDYIIALYYEDAHYVANPVIFGFDELATMLSYDCKLYKAGEFDEEYLFNDLTFDQKHITLRRL